MKKLKIIEGNRKYVLKKYLEIVNVLLPKPLTEIEQKILIRLIELGGLNSENKKQVRKEFKFYNYSNLDNYIVSMKRKGVLVGQYSTAKINPFIEVKENEFEIDFKFVVNEME